MKKKGKKEKKNKHCDPAPCPDCSEKLAIGKVVIETLYSNMDDDVANIVQNLKERMMEAATAELPLKAFIDECSQIGARAVVLAAALDDCNGTLRRLKSGMNRATQNGSCDVSEETEVPGATGRSET